MIANVVPPIVGMCLGISMLLTWAETDLLTQNNYTDNMNCEIIQMKDVKLIGITKEIEMSKAPEECPKFWQEYWETLIRPVMEGGTPNAQQRAAMENHIGQYALCLCELPDHDCSQCAKENLGKRRETFSYIIAGTYEGGEVPEGMRLCDLPDGEWLKFSFEGGMAAFSQQYMAVYKEWLPAHPAYKVRMDYNLEWYEGMDITAPDYRCGVIVPLLERP